MNISVIKFLGLTIAFSLFALFTYIFRKYFSRKNSKILLIIVAIIIIIGAELLFIRLKYSISFNSLEEAFNSEISNGKIVEIIEKDDIGLILYKEGKDTTLHINQYRKDKNNNWFIEYNPFQLFNNCQTYSFRNHYRVCKYYNENSNVMILLINFHENDKNEKVTISDSLNSKFVDFTEKIGDNNGWRSLYVVLDNIDENYYLNIEDEKVYLR